MKTTNTITTYLEEQEIALQTATEKLANNTRINNFLEMASLYRKEKMWDREQRELIKLHGYLLCLVDLKQITNIEALAFYEYNS